MKTKIKNEGITGLWEGLAKGYSSITAVIDRHNDIELTYSQLYKTIQEFAAGLQSLGLKKGQHVSLFSENSVKWLVADQAALMCGAVDAVRGSQTPTEELLYILEHSDSIGLIAENLDTIEKLKDYSLNFIVCLSDEAIPEGYDNVYSYDRVIEMGKDKKFNPVEIEENEIATLVYTSGTTGKPKGVMLSHKNLLSQITAYKDLLPMSPGEVTVNILPTWHVYERTSEYYLLSRGVTMVYSGVNSFKDDIKRYEPDYLILVPRIWEALYSGIQAELKKQSGLKQKVAKFLIRSGESHIKASRIKNKMCVNTKTRAFSHLARYFVSYPAYKLGEKLIYKKIQAALGSNFKYGISGGGALAGHIEDFFESIGINIIVGYGLTEASPVLTLRRQDYNLRLSAGKPLPKTRIKIRDGVVYAKGPQVMKGYYKDQKATDEVICPDGWLNTGDIGWMTPENDLVLTGRSKDIIVLSNGENIEPQPLEDALLQSPYISQAMLVGQDRAHLGALIVPAQEHADNPELEKILKKEIKEKIQRRQNFRPFEKIHCFKVINEPFSIENGLLTRTMKVKKSEVLKKYAHLVEGLW